MVTIMQDFSKNLQITTKIQFIGEAYFKLNVPINKISWNEIHMVSFSMHKYSRGWCHAIHLMYLTIY